MSQQNIECPKCNHQFCAKCPKALWEAPQGGGRLQTDRGYCADLELVCCSCGTANLGEYWHLIDVPENKQNLEKNQLDFFK